MPRAGLRKIRKYSDAFKLTAVRLSHQPGMQVKTPEEALEDAYLQFRAALEAELLEAVTSASPAFFEELVVDLLVRMGYGGRRPDAAWAVGRTGDGGIDGVIDEDRLSLDVIYVQVTRWQGTVGRPEIQKFAGGAAGSAGEEGHLHHNVEDCRTGRRSRHSTSTCCARSRKRSRPT